MSKELQEAIGDVLATFPEMDFMEAYSFCVHNLHLEPEETEDASNL